MTPPAIVADRHGNRYASVDVGELNDWAQLLFRIQDWLAHAHEHTIVDWADFAGPCGDRLDDITDTLGRWSARMRNLAQGRP